MTNLKSIRHLLIGALTCLLVSCSQQAPEGFTITGRIEGLPDGTKIELLPAATFKTEVAIADTVVTNGTFFLKGKVESPRSFHIIIGKDKGLFTCLIDNHNIKITAKATYSERDNFYELSQLKIEGSAAQDEYIKKMAPATDIEKQLEQESQKKGSIYAKVKSAFENGEDEKGKALQETDEFKEMIKLRQKLYQKEDSIVREIIKKNKDSWWGPFLMFDQLSEFGSEEEKTFNSFSKEAKESYYGKAAAKEFNQEVKEGEKIKPLLLKTEKGETVNYQSLIAGKKYLLIDFWASWCAPCRASIPNLKSLYAKYAPKGLQIISISIDADKSQWKKACTEEKLPWPSFLDQDRIAQHYQVRYIPQLFLINSNGILITKLSAEEVDGKLNSLFK